VAVDFLKTYADRCHHGKEEDILFRELHKKKLSEMHRKMMEELIREHTLARANVRKLAEAEDRYRAGDKGCLAAITANLQILITSYPKHIEKEDKHFFMPCMGYFTGEEQTVMLDECREFDRKLIHEKYVKIVDEFE
jgi:hemerythrin-like domain-containing protein